MTRRRVPARFPAITLLLALILLAGGRAATAQSPKHNCNFCHNLHGASYAKLSDYAVSEDLCLSCHGDAGPSAVNRDGVMVTVPKNVTVHTGAKHVTATTCVACHGHEGDATGNLALVRKTVQTPNSGAKAVAFQAYSGAKSYADGDATYDGICEVCHTTTSYHRNNGTGAAHNAAADCRTCHRHARQFSGAGGTCLGCHDKSQDNGDGVPVGGRRAIKPEFAAASGYPSHHVQADSTGTADCESCHDQSQHGSGVVRLKNADTPTTIYTLTADPAVNATEAKKLTPFCLSCHDANAAGGRAPFLDGLTPPVIDASAWTSSSHGAAVSLGSCYGNGIFGCHASGHGSKKRKLLAPAGVAPVAPANTEQEEGFCYACHKSGGTAKTNIQAQWATAARWVNAAAGMYDNLNLNDRHDVHYDTQVTSGAKVECTDCHNPHVDNASRKVKTDPDPSDGRVPGTGAVLAGATFMTEFCLDCHDGSMPVTVTLPTTQLVDIRTMYGNGTPPSGFALDSHGSKTGSPSLLARSQYAAGDVVQCRACHNPHPISKDRDLFQLVDTTRSKDGLTALPFDNTKGTTSFVYGVTDLATSRNDANAGYNWCNSCHAGSMGSGKANCFACHRHGDGRF